MEPLSGRILVIDDSAGVRAELTRLLGYQDGEEARPGRVRPPRFELDAVASGVRGHELACRARDEGRPYAVAFVDVRLPGEWDGLTTIEELWRVDPSIQIVICTAACDQGWRALLERLGPTDGWLILGKPFAPVEVLQMASSLVVKWNRERELVEAQAALALSARMVAVGQVAAGIVHEIHNPILYVLANQALLEERLYELAAIVPPEGAELVDEMHRTLGEIGDGAVRVAEIVRDMRALARGDDPRLARFSLNEAIRSAMRVASAELKHRTIVTTRFGAEVTVLGSEGRMSQVFVNLLVNAAQALADHAQAGAERRIDVRTERIDGVVVARVSDNGPGIRADHLPRIFESHFTTRRGQTGAGLGLAISRDIVRSHGGDLTVESTPGRGSIFTLVLPCADTPFELAAVS